MGAALAGRNLHMENTARPTTQGPPSEVHLAEDDLRQVLASFPMTDIGYWRVFGYGTVLFCWRVPTEHCGEHRQVGAQDAPGRSSDFRVCVNSSSPLELDSRSKFAGVSSVLDLAYAALPAPVFEGRASVG